MKQCIHEEVCQHRIEDLKAGESCTLAKVCRYYETTVSTDKPAKRKYARQAKPDADDGADIGDCDVTEKQFKKARKKIANAKQHGKLDDNQELALKSLKGIQFKTATAAQKEQIVNIARDL